jgi:ketosteroid isomerase-like protein
MSTAADLVREFDAAFNARQLNRLAEIVTPDIEMISPRGAARGQREVCALLEAGFETFPDLAVEPIHLVEDGASAAAQQRFTSGQLAACELVMVDTRAGLINSWRTYYDQLPVLVAAGLAPPQPGGPAGARPAAPGRRECGWTRWVPRLPA